MPHKRRLSHERYTVAIICPLEIELRAVRYMLDEEHEGLPQDSRDPNRYVLGTFSGHNVVLATLPAHAHWTVPAARVAVHLTRTFCAIKMRLLVGIGGGIPNATHDIRLGDVVVSDPQGSLGGVVQYDMGAETVNGFRRTGSLKPPPAQWQGILNAMKANHRNGPNRISSSVSTMLQRYPQHQEYRRPPPTADVLFNSSYTHKNREPTCASCNTRMTVPRAARSSPQESKVFYGRIASGDRVIKAASKRDLLARDCGGALCFEMEAAGLMNDFECIVIRGISDYSDSHKNDHWHGYAAAAASALAKEILTYPFIAFELLEAGLQQHDPRRIDILNSLHFFNYQEPKDSTPRRVDGTWEWLIHDSQFQDWNEGRARGLLLVSGDPGCGKSVLTRYLVDEVILNSDSRTVCYFFFGDTMPYNYLVLTLSCILHQLFTQHPELLCDTIVEQFKQGDELIYDSFEMLWGIFLSVTQHHTGEIVIILDAFSELSQESQDELLKAFYRLFDDEKPTCELKILLTSQPYPSVQTPFHILDGRVPWAHIRGEESPRAQRIAEDINAIIRHRVAEIAASRHLLAAEQEFILAQLTSLPNWTYIWPQDVLEAIESSSSITTTTIRETIQILPRSLDEASSSLLWRFLDHDDARTLYHILVAARRPLSVGELAMAMAIKQAGHANIEIESTDKFKESIREVSRLLATIPNDKVHLLDPTINDLLVQNPGERHQSIAYRACRAPSESHEIMAKACLELLHSQTLNIASHNWDRMVQTTAHDPFLQYAIENWHYHLRKADLFDDDPKYRLVKDILARKDDIGWFWHMNGMVDRPIFPLTPLMKASFLGLDHAVTDLLQTQPASMKALTHCGRSALSLAAEAGHDNIVQILLSHAHRRCFILRLFTKPAANKPDKTKRTPLWYAATRGHKSTVKLLLEAKASPDTKDTESLTPLASAATNGHTAIVQFLLATGKVNPNSKDSSGRTPLMHAVHNNDVEIVRLLLATRTTDLTLRDKYDWTALDYASKHGITDLLDPTGCQLDDNYDEDFTISRTISESESVVDIEYEQNAAGACY